MRIVCVGGAPPLPMELQSEGRPSCAWRMRRVNRRGRQQISRGGVRGGDDAHRKNCRGPCKRPGGGWVTCDEMVQWARACARRLWVRDTTLLLVGHRAPGLAGGAVGWVLEGVGASASTGGGEVCEGRSWDVGRVGWMVCAWVGLRMVPASAAQASNLGGRLLGHRRRQRGGGVHRGALHLRLAVHERLLGVDRRGHGGLGHKLQRGGGGRRGAQRAGAPRRRARGAAAPLCARCCAGTRPPPAAPGASPGARSG